MGVVSVDLGAELLLLVSVVTVAIGLLLLATGLQLVHGADVTAFHHAPHAEVVQRNRQQDGSLDLDKDYFEQIL